MVVAAAGQDWEAQVVAMEGVGWEEGQEEGGWVEAWEAAGWEVVAAAGVTVEEMAEAGVAAAGWEGQDLVARAGSEEETGAVDWQAD
jgi:hypothetical protein